jgi:hypothetical protein
LPFAAARSRPISTKQVSGFLSMAALAFTS